VTRHEKAITWYENSGPECLTLDQPQNKLGGGGRGRGEYYDYNKILKNTQPENLERIINLSFIRYVSLC